jgi:lysozyme
VKATEGLTYMNPTFSTDWPAIASNGLVRGAYHYFHPTDDPIQQADYFLTTVGNFGANDLPPLFDWEETDGVSAETDVQNALVWLQRVSAATGKTPIVYADPSFINGLGNPSALSQYPFFIANYNVTCPAIPPPWNGWLFWQTGTGSASGVPDASADLDVFNGTVSQLQLFASTGVY